MHKIGRDIRREMLVDSQCVVKIYARFAEYGRCSLRKHICEKTLTYIRDKH